jgi:hypothetical protein
VAVKTIAKVGVVMGKTAFDDMPDVEVEVCFWSWTPKTPVLLPKGFPQKKIKFVVKDYNPSPQVMKEWEKGIVYVEVTPEPTFKGQPPMLGLYPTGRWVVAKKETMDILRLSPDIQEKILAKGFCLMGQEQYEPLFGSLSKVGGPNV